MFQYLSAPWFALGAFLKRSWLSLPLWSRQTIVQALETGILAFCVVIYQQYSGHQSIDFAAAEIVALQAIMKLLRSNPNIQIPDYVNKIDG